MLESQKRLYFDALASRWDGFTNHTRVRTALKSELAGMALAPNEHIVDLGCGTGNLTAVLLEVLGPAGRITAVDFSGEMIEKAKGKLPDPRVEWCVADAVALPLDSGSCDRVICFSAWPHFPDPSAVLQEMYRILRDDGILTVLHTDGREVINQIHTTAADAIRNDMLPPAVDVATLFAFGGFVVEECQDTPARYSVQGRKRHQQ